MEQTQRLEQIKGLAKEMGFTKAEVINAADFVFVDSYRKYCEDNLCGNYGKNYACPPYCGTVEEMKERTRGYEKALVLRTDYAVQDAMDGKETGPLKKEHSQRSRRLVKTIRERQLCGEGLTILAGPCNLCSPCKMAQGLLCPIETKERSSCLSAYCIDVCELAKTAGMEISWDMNKVSFYSLYLFNI